MVAMSITSRWPVLRSERARTSDLCTSKPSPGEAQVETVARAAGRATSPPGCLDVDIDILSGSAPSCGRPLGSIFRGGARVSRALERTSRERMAPCSWTARARAAHTRLSCLLAPKVGDRCDGTVTNAGRLRGGRGGAGLRAAREREGERERERGRGRGSRAAQSCGAHCVHLDLI